MKKVVFLLFLLVVIISLVGCGLVSQMEQQLSEPIEIEEQASPSAMQNEQSFNAKLKRVRFSLVKQRSNLIKIKNEVRNGKVSIYEAKLFLYEFNDEIIENLNQFYEMYIPAPSSALYEQAMTRLNNSKNIIEEHYDSISETNVEVLEGLIQNLIYELDNFPS
ncbi:MAG: hypothetical protein ACOCQR_01955 [bacterium]